MILPASHGFGLSPLDHGPLKYASSPDLLLNSRLMFPDVYFILYLPDAS